MRSPGEGPEHRAADPTDDPDGTRALGVELRRMNGQINRIAHALAHAQGLHPTDVQALVLIMDAPRLTPGRPMTPGRLGDELKLTSGAVTACLDRLERSGHIRRVRDAHDRRVVHLRHEPAAMDVTRGYVLPLSESTREARARLTGDQLEVVLGFLRTLNDELAAHRADASET
ncbi:MarR family winged helix-turn-helix transcriptional regulator [Actinomadura rugatobispora]|uniref:MarR family winged helix-turn-helix transcriptional regulator n=1 Tax=Actinomadura rugatobispora TaxID=1994 RepID=A0ABW1AGA3_9ACTN|nr:MarR family winged helix-turn-helix transcriptional regulator [Actinomadura rugatobispora]